MQQRLSGRLQVYCDALEGWALIMKVDGRLKNFEYSSSLWSTKSTLNTYSLSLDDTEAKLASYWTLPFTELRLGMKVPGRVTRWITVRYKAESLYSVIADGQFRRTNVGKSTWRSLVPGSSLQRNCNKVMFSNKSKIGIDQFLIRLSLGRIQYHRGGKFISAVRPRSHRNHFK